ncbi:MAG: carbon storage regulator [Planctomycetaceae bacterium]|jgi:carbon storage regulator|nr:carbon storage regulator [Planctomycetaceae bacterium]
MLVLSRKEGERIRIGEDIFVTIVHTAKDRVHIGIEAPLNAVIIRDELRPKIAVVGSGEMLNKTPDETEIKIVAENKPEDVKKLAS